MKLKSKLIFILVFLLISINVAYANDVNQTELTADDVTNESSVEVPILKDNSSLDSDNISQKSHPVISIDSTKVKSKDTLKIDLKDCNGTALPFKSFKASINNKDYKLSTNSKGITVLNINLPAGNYNLKISVGEDDNFTSFSKTFKITVSKLSTSIKKYSNFVLNNNYFYAYLKDGKDNGVASKKVSVKVNGKTFSRKTDKNGRIALKIKSSSKIITLRCKFDGDRYYKASSKKISFYVNQFTSIKIGNSRLLTGGFVRVYLNDATKSKIWKKTIKITIGNKRFSKKTNSEGIVVIKPKMSVGKYKITASFGKYYTSKIIRCFNGNVKDPLKEAIPLRNGVPDIDVMPGNFVWADGSGTYTLTKAQYMEVLKRDSYCLFLNNKLTKYTFFKTKSHPKTNHLIKREKWNVIEKAINQKLVDANKQGYWPGSITVSLKGKSYSYPEIRDWQDTSYTCGPTSCSMCSQVLKNYLCESYLAKHSGTTRADGTTCSGMVKALEKENFICTLFYRNSFSKALNELKKGGCAVVFHAKHHYVAILDISKDGKKVLVSNSYGSYDDIPSKWLTVEYMKTRYYKNYDDGLIVRLNYKLSKNVQNQINLYYSSMAPNWAAHNIHEVVS